MYNSLEIHRPSQLLCWLLDFQGIYMFVRIKQVSHSKTMIHRLDYRIWYILLTFDNLYKRLRLTNPESQMYQTLSANLKQYQSILQRNINTAKKIHYEETFKRHISNIKQTWRTINEILNKCNNKKDFPSYFIIDSKKITDKKEIANFFNIFFRNVGPTYSANIPLHQDKNIESYLKERITFSFKFHTVDEETIIKIIEKLKPKHTQDYDKISTILLKRISHIIATPLTLIINQSLATGIFPDKLKISKIIPLFKKDDPHKLDNYRPISLLSAFSKVIEKAVFIQLYKYFTDNNLFYQSQYGFRTQHSTELASLEITDIILKDIDNGKLPIGIFLDLSKAFDTLDHNIMLRKLNYYGIKGTELAWFKSYLSNRHQFVHFDGCDSPMLSISTGVPQGSILGPLLFIIYMNDIHNASNKFHAILFADDSNFTSTLCSFDENDDVKQNRDLICNKINSELKCIQTWLEVNKLSLNIKKTKFMIFHNKRRNIEHMIPKLVVNGQNIDRVKEFDFLGLTIDENLNWTCHVQKIGNKISRSLGIINKLKRFLPMHVLKILYNSLILPHLQYCLLAWGFKSDRLHKLQKRALRIITCSKYNAHTEPLFKNLNLLTIKDMMKTKALKFFYHYTKNELPLYFESLFPESNSSHDHNTRNKAKLKITATKSCLGRLCIRHYIPELINNTISSITEKVNTHSFDGFSKYVKHYYIQQYSENCQIENCFICQN
jgi:tetrahydromethanopterin S-methyltransferase subunit G